MKRLNLRRIAGLGIILTAVGTLSVGGALEASAAATGTIKTAGDPLNVRRAPTTSATAVKTVANGASVSIDCQTTGTSVTGTFGTSTLWDYVPALGGYVSDTYVNTGSDTRVAPDCGVGTGSGQCADACVGEGQYRSSDSHFLVYDTDADGYSAVVTYWLKGGASTVLRLELRRRGHEGRQGRHRREGRLGLLQGLRRQLHHRPAGPEVLQRRHHRLRRLTASSPSPKGLPT